ncbi:hypothetical protein JNK13_01170 [bacterium]|nr:hypothetical protein [bacterium]
MSAPNKLFIILQFCLIFCGCFSTKVYLKDQSLEGYLPISNQTLNQIESVLKTRSDKIQVIRAKYSGSAKASVGTQSFTQTLLFANEEDLRTDFFDPALNTLFAAVVVRKDTMTVLNPRERLVYLADEAPTSERMRDLLFIPLSTKQASFWLSGYFFPFESTLIKQSSAASDPQTQRDLLRYDLQDGSVYLIDLYETRPIRLRWFSGVDQVLSFDSTLQWQSEGKLSWVEIDLPDQDLQIKLDVDRLNFASQPGNLEAPFRLSIPDNFNVKALEHPQSHPYEAGLGILF